jgi:hypothetical protein
MNPYEPRTIVSVFRISFCSETNGPDWVCHLHEPSTCSPLFNQLMNEDEGIVGTDSTVKRTTMETSIPNSILVEVGFVWNDGRVERMVKRALYRKNKNNHQSHMTERQKGKETPARPRT